MTAYYYDFYSATGSNVNVVIKAVLYTVEIKSFTYSNVYNGTQYGGPVSRYSPATLTGGTAYIPAPYRDGSAPASAILKSNTVVSGGTSIPIHAYPYTTTLTATFAVTIKPGDAIIFAPNPATPGTGYAFSFSIAFDEWRLARSV